MPRAVKPAPDDPPEWTMEDDTTPITDEIILRYDFVKSKPVHASWQWLYVMHGRQYLVDQLQGFYQNIALVAALTGGFSMGTILSFDGQEGDAYVLYIAISGAAIFALLFGCVLDCILIDNTVRLIPDDKYLLDFLRTESVLLSVPFYLFVGGLIVVFTNISIIMRVSYGLVSMICCFVAFTIVGLLVLRRYVLLSAKLSTYACWGLLDIKKKAEKMKADKEKAGRS